MKYGDLLTLLSVSVCPVDKQPSPVKMATIWRMRISYLDIDVIQSALVIIHTSRSDNDVIKMTPALI